MRYIWHLIVWPLGWDSLLALWRPGRQMRGSLTGRAVYHLRVMSGLTWAIQVWTYRDTLRICQWRLFNLDLNFHRFRSDSAHVRVHFPSNGSILKDDIPQPGTSRDEHQPASPHKFIRTWCQPIWDVCNGWTPSSCTFLTNMVQCAQLKACFMIWAGRS